MFIGLSNHIVCNINTTINYNSNAGLPSTLPLHKLIVNYYLLYGDIMKEKKAINIQIGNEIKKARERAGLTQEQFGEMVSLGTKNVSDIERGVSGITVSTLKRICEKLPVSSDTILFGKYEENNIEYLTEQLKKLSPKKFDMISALLNKIFEIFSKLND